MLRNKNPPSRFDHSEIIVAVAARDVSNPIDWSAFTVVYFDLSIHFLNPVIVPSGGKPHRGVAEEDRRPAEFFFISGFTNCVKVSLMMSNLSHLTKLVQKLFRARGGSIIAIVSLDLLQTKTVFL